MIRALDKMNLEVYGASSVLSDYGIRGVYRYSVKSYFIYLLIALII